MPMWNHLLVKYWQFIIKNKLLLVWETDRESNTRSIQREALDPEFLDEREFIKHEHTSESSDIKAS